MHMSFRYDTHPKLEPRRLLHDIMCCQVWVVLDAGVWVGWIVLVGAALVALDLCCIGNKGVGGGSRLPVPVVEDRGPLRKTVRHA